MKKHFSSKILSPILSYLKKGISVEKMSLSLALGICFGIMPLFGVSTWLLVLLALILKLNIPAIQLINYTVVIVKIVLFVPFLKLGQLIFFPLESDIELNTILTRYHADFLGTFKSFWHLNLGGIIIWSLIAIPLGVGIYYLSQPALKRQSLRLQNIK